jgi:ParB-like chromosome segregation protein Spo0J
MSDQEMASLRHGFKEDGWLVSQALTIWRTDETGQEQNIIIDGEHRWLCALDVGLTDGPYVPLDGIPEREAKALTFKLYKRRGEWTEEGTVALLSDLEIEDMARGALDFAFTDDELEELLKQAEHDAGAAAGAASDEGDGERQRKRNDKEDVEPSFCVLVECATEAEQTQVLEECLGKGWQCRALI